MSVIELKTKCRMCDNNFRVDEYHCKKCKEPC